MAEGLVLLLVPAALATVAVVGAARGVVYLHGVQGMAIRQRLRRPLVSHRIPEPNGAQPLSLVYERDERLSRMLWQVTHLRSNPQQSQAVVAKYNRVLRDYLALVDRMCDEALTQRASRQYRANSAVSNANAITLAFSDDVLRLAVQLAHDRRNQPVSPLRPAAQRLVEKFDLLRVVLVEQSLRNCTKYTDEVKDALMGFEDAYVDFEQQYLVAPPSHYVSAQQGQLAVVLAEAVRLALKHGLIDQDDLESMEPSLFFVVPRLALVYGLYYTDAIKLESRECADIFRHQLAKLTELKKRLRGLGESAVRELEKALADRMDDDDASFTASSAARRSRRLGVEDISETDTDADDDAAPRSSGGGSSSSGSSSSGSGGSGNGGRFRTYFGKRVATSDVDRVHAAFIDVCEIADHMHSGQQVKVLRNALRVVFAAYQHVATAAGDAPASQQQPALHGMGVVPTASVLRVSADARELLTTGAVFLKMGRKPKSKPHKRFLWLSDNLREILWCSPSKDYSPKPSRLAVDSVISANRGGTLANAAQSDEDHAILRIVGLTRSLELIAPATTCAAWEGALQELLMATPRPGQATQLS